MDVRGICCRRTIRIQKSWVLKNYVSSFASNVDDNIAGNHEKGWHDLNRRKTNPLIYVKFWRQACLPFLLFGTELFRLNASQLIKLERCQQWFLKNIFYVPVFAPSSLLLKLSGLKSFEAEIDPKNLCFGAFDHRAKNGSCS